MKGSTVELDRLELLTPIGRGTLATVFRARTADGSVVAAKRVPAQDAAAVARLHREAEALGRVTHPGVLAPHGLVERDGEVLLVMPLAERSLADLVASHPDGLDAGAVRQLGIHLAEALAACHARGIVHRDVKPANVLLVDGHPRLGDFGTARLHDRATLGGAGRVLGSAPYLDPRVTEGAEPDASADVYALAATLHEALTGQPPFVGPTAAATLDAARHRPYRAPATPDVPGLGDLLGAALHLDPARRPRSAGALAAALAALEVVDVAAGEQPDPAPPPELAPPPLQRRSAEPADTRSFGPRPPGRRRRRRLAGRVPLPATRSLAATAGIVGVAASSAAAAASLHLG